MRMVSKRWEFLEGGNPGSSLIPVCLQSCVLLGFHSLLLRQPGGITQEVGILPPPFPPTSEFVLPLDATLKESLFPLPGSFGKDSAKAGAAQAAWGCCDGAGGMREAGLGYL